MLYPQTVTLFYLISSPQPQPPSFHPTHPYHVRQLHLLHLCHASERQERLSDATVLSMKLSQLTPASQATISTPRLTVSPFTSSSPLSGPLCTLTPLTWWSLSSCVALLSPWLYKHLWARQAATNSQETELVVLMQQRDQQSQSGLPSNERWSMMSSSRDKAKWGGDEWVRERAETMQRVTQDNRL